MKRTPTRHGVTAKALTDPKPVFVSMVKGGANQRPFRAVKADTRLIGAEETGDTPATEEEPTMTKKSIKAPAGYDIAMLHFATDEFADEAAVKSWLETGGYTDFEIKAKDDGFEVKNTEIEFDPASVEEVEGAVKGMTAYIGKAKEDEPAEKSDEDKETEHATDNTSAVQPVAKGDDTSAKEAEAKSDDATDEGSKDDASKSDDSATGDAQGDDANDGAPSSEDVQKALDWLEQAQEKVKAKKNIGEAYFLTDLINMLRWIVDDAPFTGISDEQVNGIKSGAGQLIVALSSMLTDSIADLEMAFKAHKGETAQKSDDQNTDAGDAAADDGAGDAASTETGAEEEPKGDADAGGEAEQSAKGNAPDDDAMAAIKALTKTVEGLVGTVGEVKAKVDETESDLTARLSKMETTSQSRKGADVTGGETAPDTEAERAKKANSEAASRRIRSAIGSPNAADLSRH